MIVDDDDDDDDDDDVDHVDIYLFKRSIVECRMLSSVAMPEVVYERLNVRAGCRHTAAICN